MVAGLAAHPFLLDLSPHSCYTPPVRPIEGSSAPLKEGHFNSANLTDADLSGANLVEADLTGADLAGADLSGADLTGAKVTKEQLRECKSLDDATLPSGTVRVGRRPAETEVGD